jgi:hypothetical protein
MVHRVPTGLDAAHVGFIFIDVVGNGHCGAPSRGMISQPGLSMPILFPILNLVAGSSRGHHGCASSTGALPQGERKTFTCIDIGKRFALARQLDFYCSLLVISQRPDPSNWAAGKPGSRVHCYKNLPALSSCQN